MKVYFQSGNRHYPKGGKAEGCVYAYYRGGDICVMRRYVDVAPLPQHLKIREVQTLSLSVWSHLPVRVKGDFSRYAKLHKKAGKGLRRQHAGSYAVFLKVMHRLVKHLRICDFGASGLDDVMTFISGQSVADFIRLGWLPRVQGFYRLNETIYHQDRVFMVNEAKIPVLSALIRDEIPCFSFW